MTFQDNWSAFRMTRLMNLERLMWANDCPNGDPTCPNSWPLIEKHTAHLSGTDKSRILRDGSPFRTWSKDLPPIKDCATFLLLIAHRALADR